MNNKSYTCFNSKHQLIPIINHIQTSINSDHKSIPASIPASIVASKSNPASTETVGIAVEEEEGILDREINQKMI